MTARTVILVAACLGFAGPVAVAQDSPPPPGSSNKPIDIYARVRSLMNEGRYETAAEYLQDFLKAQPGEADYLQIEADPRFGVAAFETLRTVARWYEDPKKNAEFVKKGGTLDTIITQARAANQKQTRDPGRITRFVRRLGGVPEERQYAIEELKRSGDAAVPFLINSLRDDTSAEQRSGIYSAVTALGIETVPPVLAAAEGVADELKIGLLQAVVRRSDSQSLIGKTDTNFLPHLWYLYANPARPATRDASAALLESLLGPGFERRPADAELVRFAEVLFNRQGQFVATVPDPADNTPKGEKRLVRVWAWNEKDTKVEFAELPYAQAEERFGLKYLRWALERNPASDAARSLFVALAVERAMERAKLGELAKSEPNAYRLLAATPTDVVIGLLDQALNENRTALALGLIQGLSDRADRVTSATDKRENGSQRTPVLAKALNYSDPRVQLAAAVALLRVPPTHGANARVVEVLGRAVSGDAVTGGATAGKAVVADPSTIRGDQLSTQLRQLGYATETVESGRELFRLVSRTSDIDLIVVDRHIVNPTLPDVLSLLKADSNAGRRPVLVVASADNPKPLGMEILLLRLAVLIATTETSEITPTPIPLNDRERQTADENQARRTANADVRDRQFAELYRLRLARLERLVRAADLETTPAIRERLALRLPQLTFGVLIAEFEPTSASAPLLFRDYKQANRLLAGQPELEVSTRTAPIERLVKLIRQLDAAVVADPSLSARFDAIRKRVNREELQLPAEPVIDPAAAEVASKAARMYPNVTVIAEPYAKETLAADLNMALDDQTQKPRDAADKKADAKTAVTWLKRIAVGETPGYDVRPAEPALRTALANDELATDAADALARIPLPAAQLDLVRAAGNAARPVPARTAAADAAVRHIQSFGRLTDAKIDLSKGESDPALRSKLYVLNNLLAPGGELLDRIKVYAPTSPPPPAAPKKEGEEKPKTEEKKDEK